MAKGTSAQGTGCLYSAMRMLLRDLKEVLAGKQGSTWYATAVEKHMKLLITYS